MSSISSGGLLTLNTVTPLAGNITLTSNDGSVIFTPGAGTLNLMATGSGGSGITTIDGDVSSVTGSTVTITGGTSGAVFIGDGTTTMTQSFNHLSLPDSTSDSLGVVYINSVPFMHAYPGTASNNVFVGENAGNFSTSGTDNVGVGNAALASLSSGGVNSCIGNQSGTLIDAGSENVALGHVSLVSATSANQQTAIGCNALAGVVSGIYNTALGFDSGGNYTGSESYNICINATGVVGDMNVLRIGIGGDIGGGDVTTAYIGGISGNAPGAGDEIVYINTTTGQMSSAAAGSFGISSWVDVTAATQQMDPGVGYSANAPADVVLFTLPASATIGSQIIVTGSGSFGWQILQNSGQTVYFGSVSTTTGASGSLTSTNGRDVVYLRCVVADNDWQVESSIGNITYA